MSSRGAIAFARTGRRVAYRRARDAPMAAASRARQKAAPINSAGAQAIARQTVKRVIRSRAEAKFWTVAPTAIVMDTTGLIQSVFDPPTGTTDQTRTGDKVQMLNFYIPRLLGGGHPRRPRKGYYLSVAPNQRRNYAERC